MKKLIATAFFEEGINMFAGKSKPFGQPLGVFSPSTEGFNFFRTKMAITTGQRGSRLGNPKFLSAEPRLELPKPFGAQH